MPAKKRHYAPWTSLAGRAYESLLQAFHTGLVSSSYFSDLKALMDPDNWHVHCTQSGLCILSRYEALADSLRGDGRGGSRRWHIDDGEAARSVWMEMAWKM